MNSCSRTHSHGRRRAAERAPIAALAGAVRFRVRVARQRDGADVRQENRPAARGRDRVAGAVARGREHRPLDLQRLVVQVEGREIL